MKDIEILERVQTGEAVAVVEYRGSEVDEMKWTHEKTGRTMTAQIVRHRVETSSESFTVTEFLPDGYDTSKFVCPFKKGQRVVWIVEKLFRNKGAIQAGGTLFDYQPSVIKPM